MQGTIKTALRDGGERIEFVLSFAGIIQIRFEGQWHGHTLSADAPP